jgi:hypothetical protein
MSSPRSVCAVVSQRRFGFELRLGFAPLLNRVLPMTYGEPIDHDASD